MASSSSPLPNLPVELLTKVYKSCNDVPSVLALASTCKTAHRVWTASPKLAILTHIMEIEIGPLQPIINVACHNSSESVFEDRKPAISLTLLKQLYGMGRVVKKWVHIYPMEKWHNHPTLRRSLYEVEVSRLRCAIYRVWLYVAAFHCPEYRSELIHRPNFNYPADERLVFICKWPNSEIGDFDDVVRLFRSVLNRLFPSRSMIQKEYKKNFPNSGQLYFGTYDTHHTNQQAPLPKSDQLPVRLSREAWGDTITQKRRVEDLIKLNPAQILELRETTTNKAGRKAWLHRNVAQYFWHHGATMPDVVSTELSDRNYICFGEWLHSGVIVQTRSERLALRSGSGGAADKAKLRGEADGYSEDSEDSEESEEIDAESEYDTDGLDYDSLKEIGVESPKRITIPPSDDELTPPEYSDDDSDWNGVPDLIPGAGAGVDSEEEDGFTAGVAQANAEMDEMSYSNGEEDPEDFHDDYDGYDADTDMDV